MHTFLDEASIYVQAGDGGGGAAHFHREKYVPLGGPDGGDGGQGGNVLLRASRSLNTLFAFKRKRRFVAESGQPGGQNRMHGRSAKDLVVDVPVGTVVRDSETGEVLGDLTHENHMLLVARGGKGGLGNVHFKTSTNQAPGFAEKGQPGQNRWLDLELKVIAQAGLIGLPNAGKSTLLSVISAARPKIADYPFTTLSPNLGVVDAGDDTFVAADIPGLIEGASHGVGLGHEFLRHIERTLVLVHVLDAGADDPLAAFQQVQHELHEYDAALLQRPMLVVLNKTDIPEAAERARTLEGEFQSMGYEVFRISAVTGLGVQPLVFRMAAIIRTEAERVEGELRDHIEVITVPPRPEHIEVERKRKVFFVRGQEVERLISMTNLDSEEALYNLQRRLKRLGVFTALQREGIQEGATVRIGGTDLVWQNNLEPEIRPA